MHNNNNFVLTFQNDLRRLKCQYFISSSYLFDDLVEFMNNGLIIGSWRFQ